MRFYVQNADGCMIAMFRFKQAAIMFAAPYRDYDVYEMRGEGDILLTER
jgi:hypothetical protein